MQGWTVSKAGRWAQANWGWRVATVLALSAQCVPHMALARPAAIVPGADAGDDSGDGDALPYRQCVPFARQVSGIQLYGDAHTWWDEAAGHYARGHTPRAGAVMSFRAHGPMTLGHVAMVSKVIDERTVLLRHANWSPIDGRRGNIELDVRAVDVSADNDWSEVRVWYAPIGDLGTTHWPVNGFIYKANPGKGDARPVSRDTVLATADAPRVTRLSYHAPSPGRINAGFLDGIRPESDTTALRPTRTWLVARPSAPITMAPATVAPALRDDPIGRIIAAHMKRASD